MWFVLSLGCAFEILMTSNSLCVTQNDIERRKIPSQDLIRFEGVFDDIKRFLSNAWRGSFIVTKERKIIIMMHARTFRVMAKKSKKETLHVSVQDEEFLQFQLWCFIDYSAASSIVISPSDSVIFPSLRIHVAYSITPDALLPVLNLYRLLATLSWSWMFSIHIFPGVFSPSSVRRNLKEIFSLLQSEHQERFKPHSAEWNWKLSSAFHWNAKAPRFT